MKNIRIGGSSKKSNCLQYMYFDTTGGCWVAMWYSLNNYGTRDKMRFYGYSKKDVINKLRHEYDCIVESKNVMPRCMPW